MSRNYRGFVEGTSSITYLHIPDEKRNKHYCEHFESGYCTYKIEACLGSSHCNYYKTLSRSNRIEEYSSYKPQSMTEALPTVCKQISITVTKRSYLNSNKPCLYCNHKRIKTRVPLVLLGENDPEVYCGAFDNINGTQCGYCGKYFISFSTEKFIQRRFELSRTNALITHYSSEIKK